MRKQNMVAAAAIVFLLVVTTAFVYNEVGFPAPEPAGAASAEVVRDESAAANTFTGSAESYGGTLTVEVVVDQGRIQSVSVVEHKDTPGFGDRAFDQIGAAIVETQGVEVDIVSGATESSRGIIAAAERALVEANWWDDAPPAELRALTGTAESYGGVLTVEVEVEGSQITAITVVDHSDTPGFGDRAFDTVKGRILDTQRTDVDLVSGATESSKAMVAAVEAALAQADGWGQGSQDTRALIGTADSAGGVLTVVVVLEGERMLQISVVDHNDTKGFADRAFELMAEAMVEAQSTAVDTLTGATYSSQAIKAAVNDALTKAN